MSRIVKLPDDLANQIAAGEVVERPASVVKELVENALDADATPHHRHHRVRRQEADPRRGRRRSAWTPEDARLCLERHATSKIRRADDLGAIATLGFRGEALPSHRLGVALHAAHARARGSDERHRDPRRSAGIVESVVDGRRRPKARCIEVDDLFYNLPARRKFLKSDGAEIGAGLALVTQLALCYPAVGFTLTSAGEARAASARRWRPLATGCTRSTATARTWCAVDRDDAGLRLHGHAWRRWPSTGPTRGPQHVFVNRRIVKDKTIAHAIIDAYSVGHRSRSAVPRCTCSSRCRSTASTSTCTRPRPRCGFASSRWCTRSCGAVWPRRSARPGCRPCQATPRAAGRGQRFMARPSAASWAAGLTAMAARRSDGGCGRDEWTAVWPRARGGSGVRGRSDRVRAGRRCMAARGRR